MAMRRAERSGVRNTSWREARQHCRDVACKRMRSTTARPSDDNKKRAVNFGLRGRVPQSTYIPDCHRAFLHGLGLTRSLPLEIRCNERSKHGVRTKLTSATLFAVTMPRTQERHWYPRGYHRDRPARFIRLRLGILSLCTVTVVPSTKSASRRLFQ